NETPLADHLPVQMDAEGIIEGEVPVQLTTAGKEHFVLRLTEDNKDASADRWAKLFQDNKPMNVSRTGRLRDGIVGGVLIETKAGEPVLAVRSVGRGRTMALAMQDTFRWVRPPDG